MVDRINRSGAGLVFVGLGCPKQEVFAHEHRDRIDAAQLCVGAAFDFLAGGKRMAPEWMQERGLEWLFRLVSEPRRLWRRYRVTNTIFLARFGRELVRNRGNNSRPGTLADQSMRTSKKDHVMKTALVCGAGGFIGTHLVKELRRRGYWIRGVDLKRPEFGETAAQEFLELDLRRDDDCRAALARDGGPFDEVYQLAADMGGMGFIHSAECEIMRNNVTINVNMTHAAANAGVKRYFFSSSVCIYRDMEPGEPELTEADAYPANPDNEYGWEKLYSERTAMAYGRRHGMKVRIARFQNCYGPEGTWTGGREKAPAALCRKVAECEDGGTIEVWGNGSAVRSYTYVADMVDGIHRLMRSDLEGPVNIGCPQYVSVRELVHTIAEVAGKQITSRYVDGPVGVQSRNFSNERINSTGWRSRYDLKAGIAETYPWIEKQVRGSSVRSGSRTGVNRP
jgi:nucleoside-diphosphate-sugar epimerase